MHLPVSHKDYYREGIKLQHQAQLPISRTFHPHFSITTSKYLRPSRITYLLAVTLAPSFCLLSSDSYALTIHVDSLFWLEPPGLLFSQYFSSTTTCTTAEAMKHFCHGIPLAKIYTYPTGQQNQIAVSIDLLKMLFNSLFRSSRM